MGHALEGGLLDLADLVLVDAQLLQALGHVGGHVLQHVLGQVETLQLGQRGQGFGVDHGDFVVYQDQGLKREKKGHINASSFWFNGAYLRLPSAPDCFGLNSR